MRPWQAEEGSLIAQIPDQRLGVSRRTLLIGAAASFICAPAVVRTASLMPIRLVVGERHYAGWAERVGYQMMDHVLKTGWTPEASAMFYGGISESKMWSMVAYARRQGWLPKGNAEPSRTTSPRSPNSPNVKA